MKQCFLKLHLTLSAQVCFPGGMREEGDRSPAVTALRECEEETGLDRNIVKIISVLPTVK